MSQDVPPPAGSGHPGGSTGQSGEPAATSWPQQPPQWQEPPPPWAAPPPQQWGAPPGQQWGAPPGQQWGPAPGQQWGPPGQQWARPPETSGLAVGALACGIGVFVIYITWLPALILGYMAKRRIDESNGQLTGREMAIVGIVLGYVGLGFTVIIIGIILAALAAST